MALVVCKGSDQGEGDHQLRVQVTAVRKDEEDEWKDRVNKRYRMSFRHSTNMSLGLYVPNASQILYYTLF